MGVVFLKKWYWEFSYRSIERPEILFSDLKKANNELIKRAIIKLQCYIWHINKSAIYYSFQISNRKWDETEA